MSQDPILRRASIARAAAAASGRSDDSADFRTEYGRWLDAHDAEILEAPRAILARLVDQSPCDYTPNRTCRTHGDFYIPEGRMCYTEQAKQWLARTAPKEA